MAAKKIAVGYVRCSTDAQSETSPPQQRQQILAEAERRGYSIAEWFEDVGKSGTSFEKRPEFNRLLQRVMAKPSFEAVICLDETRWGRAGAEDNLYYKRHFKKIGNVDVLLVNTIARTGNRTMDAVCSVFEGGLSHEESVKKSERTLIGCESAIQEGHSAGGTAPYGYRRVAVNRHNGIRRQLGIVYDKDGLPALNAKGYAISEQIRPKEEYTVWELGDEAERTVVKRIYEMRTQYGYGYTKIANVLNAEGIPCPKRGRWMNKDQKWSQGTIGTIIRNPVYKGAMAYNRLKKKGIGKYAQRFWEKDKTKWIINEGVLPAIVSKEAWEAANPSERDRSNGRLAKKRFDNPYLLSSSMTCTHCGFKFHGKTQAVGAPGNRKKKRMYVDSGYSSKGPSVCSSFNIGADYIESRLLSKIKERVHNRDIQVELEKLLMADLEKEMREPDAERKSIEQSITAISRQIANLVEMAGMVDDVPEVAKKLENLKAERQKLEEKKSARSTSNLRVNDIQAWIDRVARFLTDFEQTFEAATLSEKKALIQKIVPRIDIDRERNVARCYMRKFPGGLASERPLAGLLQTPVLSVPPTRFELVYRA
jgi:site-specific DNA recombinase